MLLDNQSLTFNNSHSPTIQLSQPVLAAVNLCKNINSNDKTLHILSGLNLQCMPNETIAIVGASGSGKSTLLSLLAGLDMPTSGKVLLGSQDITLLDEDARAKLRGEKMGFVFQSFLLLPTLNALDNVKLPLQLAGNPHAEKIAKDALNKVGLSQRLTHLPKQLSGGEQQRVAIARAFAPQPAILFADEPTGNLDAATGQTIIELLFELNAHSGTTLVLVTHDEKLAVRCQRTLKLAHGQLTQVSMLNSELDAMI